MQRHSDCVTQAHDEQCDTREQGRGSGADGIALDQAGMLLLRTGYAPNLSAAQAWRLPRRGFCLAWFFGEICKPMISGSSMIAE